MNEHETEVRLGKLLRGGVTIAALIVAVGGILYLLQHGHQPFGHQTFVPGPEWVRTPTGIASGVLHLDGGAIIQLGLLLLIATPVARVAFAAVAFLRQGDYTYVAITLIVLGILTYSFFAGRAV